eukprot:1312738-Pyramimonas_sp.AAC.1
MKTRRRSNNSLSSMKLSIYGCMTAEAQRDLWNNNRAMVREYVNHVIGNDAASSVKNDDRSASLPSNVVLVNDGRNNDAAALMQTRHRSNLLSSVKLSSYGRLTAEGQRDLWNNNRAIVKLSTIETYSGS